MSPAKFILTFSLVLFAYYIEIAVPVMLPRLEIGPMVTTSALLVVIINLQGALRVFFAGLIGLLQDDLLRHPIGTQIVFLTAFCVLLEFLKRRPMSRTLIDQLLGGAATLSLLLGLGLGYETLLKQLNLSDKPALDSIHSIALIATQAAFSYLVFVFLQLMITIVRRLSGQPETFDELEI